MGKRICGYKIKNFEYNRVKEEAREL